MLLHRFAERTEDDAQFGQLVLERRGHGNAVEDRIDGDAGQPLLLVEGDAELLEGLAAFPDRLHRGSSSCFFGFGAE